MQLGLSLPVFTGDPVRCLDAVRRAASTAYDGVFSPDHLFPPGRPNAQTVEAWSLLAAAAATEPGLMVGTLITRVGVRPAGLLAKQASWLGTVAAGAVLGLGIGDSFARDEHAAMGLPFPPVEERIACLEETAAACRALFDGRGWPGGGTVPALTGPLTPPGSATIWFGGRSERVLEAAARSADGWNGWGLDLDGFAGRAARLAQLTRASGREPAEVATTWGGIALVGANAAELRSLEDARGSGGKTMEIWRGTVDDLRKFRDGVAASGGTWLILALAGPADRLELIADALGTR